jgi:hypothetical protein
MVPLLLIVGPAVVAAASFFGARKLLRRGRDPSPWQTGLGVALLVLGLGIVGCYGVVTAALVAGDKPTFTAPAVPAAQP